MHDGNNLGNGQAVNPIISFLNTVWVLWIVVGVAVLPYYFYLKVRGATEALPSASCADEVKFWKSYRACFAVLMYWAITVVVWFLAIFIFGPDSREGTFWLAASFNWFGLLHSWILDHSLIQGHDYLSLIQINWAYCLALAAVNYGIARMYGRCGEHFTWVPSNIEQARRDKRFNDLEGAFGEVTKEKIELENANPSFKSVTPNWDTLSEVEQDHLMNEWQAKLDALVARMRAMPRAASSH